MTNTTSQNSATFSVVITGASGMVGRGVLLACLDDPCITSILMLNRSPVPVHHDKLKELITRDFLTVTPEHLAGYDACFFCAGISALGKSEAEYTAITYDLTLHIARALIIANPDSIFCYVSGAGTDRSEAGRSMWARVKGRTENALLAMPFRRAFMFRPGYIQPLRGIRSKTRWYQLMYDLFRPIYAVLRHFPAAATNTTALGKAMIAVLSDPPDRQVLGNREINALGS